MVGRHWNEDTKLFTSETEDICVFYQESWRQMGERENEIFLPMVKSENLRGLNNRRDADATIIFNAERQVSIFFLRQ